MSKVKKPFKVLVWGDYKCQTGFATVTQNLIPKFKNHYGDRWCMDVIAINWHGIVVDEETDLSAIPAEYIVEREEDGKKVKRIHTIVEDPNKTTKKNDQVTYRTMITSASLADGKDDPFGRHIFLTKLKYFDYDLVFVINDLGIVMPHIPFINELKKEKKKENRKVFKFVYYFPVDSPPLKNALDHMELIDLPVVYTEYGKEEVLQRKPNLKGKLKTILHGVNKNHFNVLPEEDQVEFRKSFFGDNSSKVIFANVNRNQPRKDIPSTILAFERLKYDCGASNALLYLHMNPEDEMGWNLWILLSQTRLKYGEDILFMPENLIKNYPDPQFLNCIYNACDCYITTTTGEGFGLTIVEAMAAGCPVIAPNHTSITELLMPDVNLNGILLNEYYPYVAKYDSIVRQQVSIDELADEMFHVYKFYEIGEDFVGHESIVNRVTNGIKFTDKISWDIIAKKWIDEIDKLL